MKTIIKRTVVPPIEENIIEEIRYVAKDGKEFKGKRAEKECLKYEAKFLNKPDVSQIPYKLIILPIAENEVVESFYIKNNEEMCNVLMYLTANQEYLYTAHNYTNSFIGPDWYFFREICNHDYDNDYPIETLSEHKLIINNFLNNFIEESENRKTMNNL